MTHNYYQMVRGIFLYYINLSIYISCSRAVASKSQKRKKQPHVIMILADDLGWNEVSWHNSNINTPRMEVGAEEKV